MVSSLVCVANPWVFFRFIVHSDNSNPYLETLEDLEKEILKFDPSVLVVGGLQMMDNFPFKEGKKDVIIYIVHVYNNPSPNQL